MNADVLAGLSGTAPGPAYLLAFASGSPVRNRLQATRPCWRRLVECLNVEGVTRELQGAFDRPAIDEALAKLRRSPSRGCCSPEAGSAGEVAVPAQGI